MPTITFPYPAVAGSGIKSAEYNANNAVVSTLVNTTGLDDDNIQNAGISGTKLKSNVVDNDSLLYTAGVLSIKPEGVGATEVEALSITNAKISASAAIAQSKIARPAVSAIKTTTYLALTTDDLIQCDATSAGFTVTLFTAVGNTGKELTIKKTDSSFNVITVDGALTDTLNTVSESVTIVSDGANWLKKSRYIEGKLVSYTPAFVAFGTPVSPVGSYQRKHGTLLLRGSFTAGTATGSEARVPLPTGLTLGATGVFGTWFANAANTPYSMHGVSGDAYLKIGIPANFTGSRTGAEVLGTGGSVFYFAEVPVTGWSA